MNIISKIAENSYVAWVTIAKQIDENFNNIQKDIVDNQNTITNIQQDIIDVQQDISNIQSDYIKKDELPTFESSEVTVDENANSINVNGKKYTLVANDNILSLTQYVATTINKLTLSEIEYTKLQEGGGNKYIGTSYSLNCAIDIVSLDQTLSINVNNETNNKYKLSVHNGSSYILNDTDWRTAQGIINCSIPVMNNVSTTNISGIVNWGTKSNTITTTGAKTITVYLTEENKQTISSTISQENISVTSTVTAKCPVMKGTDATNTSCNTFVKDIVYGNTSGTIDLGVFEFAAGEIPTFAVPTCINKTLHGYNAEGSFEDTGWKVNETVTVSLNGCETEYDIYCIFDDTNNPKPNAGNSKINIKLK